MVWTASAVSRLVSGAAASLAVLLAASFLAAAARADVGTSVPSTIARTLELGSETGTGSLTISVEIPQAYNAQGIPTRIVDEPLVTQPISGGTLQVSIPVGDPAVIRGENAAGLAQFDFVARFGDQVASATASLPVSNPGASTSADAALVRDTTSAQPLVFSRFTSIPLPAGQASPRVGCITTLDGTWELSPRIGQMQDSTASGSKVKWTYGYQADSGFEVGISASPSSGYSGDGYYTVSNSIGASGGFSAGSGYNWYVDGHQYQVRYYGSPSYACGWSYKTYFNQAVGDSFTGTNQPGLDPWGRCGNDPYGLATMQANGGFYNADHGTAVSYSAVASFWGFSVGGHTGYTSNIYIDYTNGSSGPEYVCGTNYLPNAPILYCNSLSGS